MSKSSDASVGVCGAGQATRCADALIVADQDDAFAALLAEGLGSHGRIIHRIDFVAAGRLFTLIADAGGVLVDPTIPLVISRPSRVDTEDADARFLFGESMATLWAAAMLTSAPVVGRPTRWGFGGACSVSALVTEQRGGVFKGREEVFLQGSMAPPTGSNWWFQAPGLLSPFHSSVSSAYPGPRRGRPLRDDEQYELVLVFRRLAWCRSGVALPKDLREDSIALVGRLRLDLALVVWTISPDLRQIDLARITPWPHPHDVQFAWNPLVDAIRDYLWHDKGHRTS